MAFSFGGEFTVQRTPEETYDFLTDPNRFCPLLPDHQKVDVRDAQNFMVDVKVGISHIRGTATVKLHLAEQDHPARAIYTGKQFATNAADMLAAGIQERGRDRLSRPRNLRYNNHPVRRGGAALCTRRIS